MIHKQSFHQDFLAKRSSPAKAEFYFSEAAKLTLRTLITQSLSHLTILFALLQKYEKYIHKIWVL